MILTIRTDKPDAEIGLFDSKGQQKQYITWQAHRQLGETIHIKLAELLRTSGLEYKDLTGVVFYEGPGSFTGLRIGASVAGALSAGLNIPLINCGGEYWAGTGIKQLKAGENQRPNIVYGAEAHITQPRK